MNDNLNAPTPEEVFYAAEVYLPYLPSESQDSIKNLLRKAKGDETSIANEIISAFSEDERARLWMREALFYSGYEVTKGGFEKVAGDPSSVSASKVWICPKCNFKWHVFRIGRPVPNCPKDFSILVPFDKEV
jgi:hypothetical protein